jgi:hypothetical protein
MEEFDETAQKDFFWSQPGSDLGSVSVRSQNLQISKLTAGSHLEGTTVLVRVPQPPALTLMSSILAGPKS